MTIAAGTLCADGILMCADSEETDYVIGKYKRRKIRDFDNAPLLVSGAEWSGYLDMAADCIYERFLKDWPTDRRDARQKAAEVIHDVHENHIFNFFPSDPSRPSIDLVIATRCTDGELALIGNANSATFLARNYSISVGAGKHLWEYWAKLFELEVLPASVASYVSLFIIREIGDNVPGCGGNSDSVILLRDPKGKSTSTHYDDHRKILAAFPQSAADLLTRCVDPLTSDLAFDSSLQEFVNTLKKLRAEAKATDSFSLEIKKQIEAPENE